MPTALCLAWKSLVCLMLIASRSIQSVNASDFSGNSSLLNRTDVISFNESAIENTTKNVFERVVTPVRNKPFNASINSIQMESMTPPNNITTTLAITPVPTTTFVITPMPTINASETHGVPRNPIDVTAVASDAQAHVSWNAPEDDGGDPIIEYEVLCMVVDTNELLPKTILVTPNAQGVVPTYALVPSLQNGISYAFKVRAKNINGESTWSAKSQPVSPLHPPDMCTSHSCAGNGACFPQYNLIHQESNSTLAPGHDSASCVCKPGFLGPDCSRADESTKTMWQVTPWSSCSNGCGGGIRTRKASCVDIKTSKVLDDKKCSIPAPLLSHICNGFACGSKLIEVNFEIEIFYDDILFSSESEQEFINAFTTELASALQIPSSRIDVVSLRRGSIRVQLYLLPPTQADEKSLNEVITDLQNQVNDKNSVLRTRGTFSRRVYPSGVKMSFFIAEQHAAGEAEDISIGGLIGTLAVSIGFVAGFGYCLRKRHERIELMRSTRRNRRMMVNEKMRPMGIKTMT